MITEYILLLMVLPILVLWRFKFVDRIEEQQILNKNDTIALRGVSAFFVIAAHYMAWIDEMTDYAANAVVRGIVGQLGGIGVLIFFFASGYGIFESYGYREVDKTYLKKRFKGVYFPYILMKIIFLVPYHALGLSNGKVISELISILLVEDWFIHVIVIQYIVFYLASKMNKKYLIAISIGVDCILTVIYFYMDKPIRWFNALWLFTFGMFVAKYQKHMIQTVKKYYNQLLLVSFIGFVLLGCVFAFNKGAVWANVFKPVSGMFLCICICIIMRKCKLNSPVNMWGGKRSMHLYIVHIAIWDLLQINHPIVKLWTALTITIIVTGLIFEVTTYVSNRCFDER